MSEKDLILNIVSRNPEILYHPCVRNQHLEYVTQALKKAKLPSSNYSITPEGEVYKFYDERGKPFTEVAPPGFFILAIRAPRSLIDHYEGVYSSLRLSSGDGNKKAGLNQRLMWNQRAKT